MVRNRGRLGGKHEKMRGGALEREGSPLPLSPKNRWDDANGGSQPRLPGARQCGASSKDDGIPVEVFAGVLVGATNSSSSLPPGKSCKIFQEVLLSGTVQLWNTAPRPPLYTVRSTLLTGGAAVDTVVTTIGIRSAVWSPTAGFQLNGECV